MDRMLIFGVMAAGALSAQIPATNPKPAFQSASVKQNTTGDLPMRFTPDAPGRFTALNTSAGQLVRFAYDLPEFEVTGGPTWLNTDRFDVTAIVDGNASLEQRRLMLQRLLAERFQLASHHESRQLPIYAMRLANKNGALGPHLHRTSADCSNVPMLPLLPGRVAAAGADLRGPCGFFGMSPTTNLPAGIGAWAFRGLTMAALAKAWTTLVHRSVVDQTGLAGYYDGEFDFIAELSPPPPPPGQPNPFTTPFTSLFTVAPEQLGLKLESDRGAVDVLVIDSIQHPTAN